MKKFAGVTLGLAAAFVNAGAACAQASPSASVIVHADKSGPVINRDVFGQFTEMLGNGAYGGIWVGRDSAIPNVRGIRSDVVAAFRELHVPVVRWPGGCFADKYNWRHGIGPAERRTATINMWGNVVEPNTFGTDEYLDFMSQIGSEAYITVNVGSGTPAEAAEWLEYMTTDQPSTLGKLRAANGHPAPYRIKYLGIGNESYGCGGGMTADEYMGQYKRFATFANNLNPAQNGRVKFIKSKDAMLDIAVGPEGEKTEYTEAVMKAWTQKPTYSWDVNGIGLHYYTGGAKGVLASPSTGFGEEEYAASLKSTLKMEELVSLHSAIMDKYDPKKQVGLMVDEWGLWAKPLDGTNFMFLRQQGSMRDAIVAALNLNIFARHADSLTGGAGSDTFQFNLKTDSTSAARDTITDFTTGDRFDFYFLDANDNVGGSQHFTFIGTSAFSNVAGQLKVVDQGSGHWLVEGDTNGDGVADFSLAVTSDHALGVGDLQL